MASPLPTFTPLLPVTILLLHLLLITPLFAGKDVIAGRWGGDDAGGRSRQREGEAGATLLGGCKKLRPGRCTPERTLGERCPAARSHNCWSKRDVVSAFCHLEPLLLSPDIVQRTYRRPHLATGWVRAPEPCTIPGSDVHHQRACEVNRPPRNRELPPGVTDSPFGLSPNASSCCSCHRFSSLSPSNQASKSDYKCLNVTPLLSCSHPVFFPSKEGPRHVDSEGYALNCSHFGTHDAIDFSSMAGGVDGFLKGGISRRGGPLRERGASSRKDKIGCCKKACNARIVERNGAKGGVQHVYGDLNLSNYPDNGLEAENEQSREDREVASCCLERTVLGGGCLAEFMVPVGDIALRAIPIQFSKEKPALSARQPGKQQMGATQWREGQCTEGSVAGAEAAGVEKLQVGEGCKQKAERRITKAERVRGAGGGVGRDRGDFIAAGRVKAASGEQEQRHGSRGERSVEGFMLESNDGDSNDRVRMRRAANKHPHFPQYNYQVQVAENQPSGTSVMVMTASDPDPGEAGKNDHAPIFEHNVYKETIRENVEEGYPILQLRATDKDSPANANIRYRFVGESAAMARAAFEIDSRSGLITTRGAVDRETSEHYTLEVEASDQGKEPSPRSSTVKVHISVLDENDNVPQFSEKRYVVAVKEDVRPHSEILKVSATDRDKDSNAVVHYNIISGNSRGQFSIDSVTGEIQVVAPLDYESEREYTLRVRAQDNGRPPLSNNTGIVSVQVTDVNDNPPIFVSTPFQASVLESSPIGSSILHIQAIDTDAGDNARLEYRLTGTSADTPFVINAATGWVTVKKNLDRESVEHYFFGVEARDYGMPPLSATASVTITVMDVNDNRPEFLQKEYYARLNEDAVVGTSVVTVTAVDRDVNSAVTYQITGGNTRNRFAISTAGGSGLLSLALPLDYKQERRYVLTVTASDRTLHDTCQVHINITDANTHRPVFQSAHYSISVNEDRPPGSTVVVISATDDDVGENARITYYLDDNIPQFRIDPATGAITLQAELDYEDQMTYTLAITAKDNGIPQKSDTTYVEVNVNDVNDNAPQFLSPRYQGTVTEDAPPFISVLQISATDRDAHANGRVQYTFQNGEDGDGDFTIEPTSGIVRTMRRLDRESVPFYELTAYAMDRGVPPQRTPVHIQVTVLDVNDNAPVFPADDFEVLVKENSAVGSVVAQITATDPDEGANAQIMYQIVEGNIPEIFQMDIFSGELTSLIDLDYETKNEYVIVVQATSAPLVSRATVRIKLIDQNDNYPTLQNFQIIFNNFVSSRFNSFPSGVIGRVPAHDPDVSDRLYFTIDSGNELLLLNQTSGEIRLSQKLDNSTRALVAPMMVTVTDGAHSVSAQCILRVVIITEDMLGSSVTVRLHNMSQDHFLSLERVFIFNIQPDHDTSPQGKTILNVSFSAEHPDGRFFPSEELEEQLYLNRPRLTALTQMEVLPFDDNVCLREPCQNYMKCISVLKFNSSAPFISSNSILFRPIHPIAGLRCRCPLGFTGDYCETEINLCYSNPCLNGGVCARREGGYTCICRGNYTGELSTQVSPFVPGGVSDGDWHTVHIRYYNKPRRSAIGEAQGPSDEKMAIVSVDDCDTSLSLRFGTQLGNYSCAAQGKQTSSKKSLDLTGPLFLGGVPNVPDNFLFGSREFIGCMKDLHIDSKPLDMASFIANNGTIAGCSAKTSFCKANTCQNGGTCRVSWETFSCDCPLGFGGKDCSHGCSIGSPPDPPPLPKPSRSVKVESGCSVGNPCVSSPCPAHSRCMDQWEKFSCDCDPGYYGKGCTDACHLNPCENEAKCHRKPSSSHGYTCDCGDNHYGQYCQHRIEQQCPRGWWGSPNCGPCNCDVDKGFDPECNKTSGQCQCKEFHYRPRGSEACLPCDCYPIGSFSRTCDTETGQCQCRPGVIGRQCNSCDNPFAEVTNSGCDVIYDGCPRTITAGIWWSRTKFNRPDAVPCPKGSVGTAIRHCDVERGWLEPDLYNCTSPPFVELSTALDSVERNETELNTSVEKKLAHQLRDVTESTSHLYGKDLMIGERLLSRILTFETQQSKFGLTATQDGKFSENIVRGCSVLLSPSAAGLWRSLAQNQAHVSSSGPAQLTDLMGQYAQTLAQNMKLTYLSPVGLVAPNIVMNLDRLENHTHVRRRFPRYHTYLFSGQTPWDPYTHVVLPPAALVPQRPHTHSWRERERAEKEALSAPKAGPASARVSANQTTYVTEHPLTIVILLIYRSLGAALPPKYHTDRRGVRLPRHPVMNSPVVTVSVFNNQSFVSGHLDQPVVLEFKLLETANRSKPLCVQWNHSSSSDSGGCWTVRDCMVVYRNMSHVRCQCHRLGTFGVLMDSSHREQLEGDLEILALVSYSSLCLSMLCLLMTVLALCCLRLKSNTRSIHCNIAAAMFLSELVFLLGVNQTEQQFLCTVVAILLHYFFMSTFAWMFVEGLHIYRMQTEQRNINYGAMRFYYAIGWGVPAIITGLSVGLDPEGYGNPDFCWVSIYDKLIWSFAGPIAIVILKNGAIFMIVAKMSCNSSQKETKKLPDLATIRSSFLLLLLASSSWFFGLMAVNNSILAFYYIFNVLCLLQGVCVLLVFTVFNAEVQEAWRAMCLGKKSPGEEPPRPPQNTSQNPYHNASLLEQSGLHKITLGTSTVSSVSSARENLLARQTLDQTIGHTGATDLDVAMFHRDGGEDSDSDSDLSMDEDHSLSIPSSESDDNVRLRGRIQRRFKRTNQGERLLTEPAHNGTKDLDGNDLLSYWPALEQTDSMQKWGSERPLGSDAANNNMEAVLTSGDESATQGHRHRKGILKNRLGCPPTLQGLSSMGRVPSELNWYRTSTLGHRGVPAASYGRMYSSATANAANAANTGSLSQPASRYSSREHLDSLARRQLSRDPLGRQTVGGSRDRLDSRGSRDNLDLLPRRRELNLGHNTLGSLGLERSSRENLSASRDRLDNHHSREDFMGGEGYLGGLSRRHTSSREHLGGAVTSSRSREGLDQSRDWLRTLPPRQTSHPEPPLSASPPPPITEEQDQPPPPCPSLDILSSILASFGSTVLPVSETNSVSDLCPHSEAHRSDGQP
ncbi:hypothetical protein WMY93_027749 [Mugilogobius chulae]|uniref:Cadherin EGF LAG seven-pass G-type receptor 3 n=1 Tax=Mugilogobius chulae TaxID=88201 RepID=A0AAW0MVK2_9GOBI